MSDSEKQKKKLTARRQLLKATVMGTGAVVVGKSLPEQWSRPVVDSVVLPVHAQTSVINVGDAVMGTIVEVDASDWLLDRLVPAAMAGFPSARPSVIEGQACVQDNGDGTVNVQALFQYASWNIHYPYFTGSNVPLNTTTPLVIQNTPCDTSTFTCTVNVVLAGGAAIGSFIIEEATNTDDPDTAGQVDFNLMAPGCPIELPPPTCDD